MLILYLSIEFLIHENNSLAKGKICAGYRMPDTVDRKKRQQFPVKIERALFKGLLRIFKYFFAKCFFDKIITT